MLLNACVKRLKSSPIKKSILTNEDKSDYHSSTGSDWLIAI